MILNEAIERYTSNAEYERIHGNLQGCLDFRQLAEWLKDYKRLLEQEPCDTDTCKVAKAYMNEWDKPNNSDAISRQAVLDIVNNPLNIRLDEIIKKLPPVTPQSKTGHWEQYGNSWEDKFKCSECGKEQPKIICCERIIGHWSDYCPNCGAKMEDKE